MSLDILNPVLSPSLGEYDEAQLIDPNDNEIPCVALIHPDTATGANELGSGVITPGVVSQVTGRRGKPTVTIGGVTMPVLAVYGLSSNAAALQKSGGKFQSAVETGTGSAQSIAHGLGVVPSLVLVAPYDNTASGSTPFTFQISEGSHTSTNLLITATSGLKYKVIAFV